MASSSDGQAYLERQSEDTLQEEADAERSPLLGGRPDEDKPVEEDEDDLTEDLDGAGKTELVQAIWGTKARWLLFTGIGLSAYIYSLDSLTTYQYLYYATSTVLQHSLSGTIATVQAIIIAIGKPFMAKLADVMGRAEALVVVTVLYVIGYIVIASANTVGRITAGEIFYAFGYTGLQILQQIVIADMTTLRYRGLMTAMVSAPFIINNFVAAEILARTLPNWRLGYAMFAVLLPLCLAPLILALLWGQDRAKKLAYPRRVRRRNRDCFAVLASSFSNMDITGLLMLAISLSLILLPLGLAPEALHGWADPKMSAMMLLGLMFLPIFLFYESRVPSKPLMPMRWLRRAPIIGACLIGFTDFVSFYLQQTYLYSFILVVEPDWSYRYLTYFSAIQSLTMTIFGIVAGMLMWATKRFKYMLFCGLLIRLIGVTLMIKARSASGTTFELVLCQVLQGIGGGLAAISVQVSAQAAVAHIDVATVTAMVLLISEMGNSVGSASATAVWNANMPAALRDYVPTTNETLLEDLFGSITDIAQYAKDDPIRLGAIAAYQAVMYKLVLYAVLTAILPPIFCLLFIRNTLLTRAQNALDNRDLAGRETDELSTSDGDSWEEGQVRLSRSTSRLSTLTATPSRTGLNAATTPRGGRVAPLTPSRRSGLAPITPAGEGRGERVRMTPSKKSAKEMRGELSKALMDEPPQRTMTGSRDQEVGRSEDDLGR